MQKLKAILEQNKRKLHQAQTLARAKPTETNIKAMQLAQDQYQTSLVQAHKERIQTMMKQAKYAVTITKPHT
jgi:vacuolar-type H+-ATPase subunit H